MKGGMRLACLALLVTALARGETVSLADLQGWLSVWQKREGLDQWKINLRVVRQGEVGSGNDGDVMWSADTGTARMRVLCAADMAKTGPSTPSEIRRESELVIVHELMHLLLVPISGNYWNWSRAENDRGEAVTEAFSEMLLQRRVPGGLSEAQFINSQMSRWPGKPAPEAKRQVMLKLVRAMQAVAEDDVTALLR